MPNYMESLKTTLIDGKAKKHRNFLEFQNRLLSHNIPGWKKHHDEIQYYDLVYLVKNKKGEIVIDSDGSALVLTSTKLIDYIKQAYPKNKIAGMELNATVSDHNYLLKPYMLGEIARRLTQIDSVSTIKINPIWVVENEMDSFFMCEEILFCPLFDNYTQKKLLSDPNDAKALLALNIEDQTRYGVEFAFQTVGTPDFQNAGDQLDAKIEEKIREINFLIKRTIIPPGSASIYFVITRMENYAQELSFIRDYQTHDPNTKVLFITSRLEILTGQLEKVPYYTGDIDEIMTNILNWYKSQK
jgi:hypothetical protein